MVRALGNELLAKRKPSLRSQRESRQFKLIKVNWFSVSMPAIFQHLQSAAATPQQLFQPDLQVVNNKGLSRDRLGERGCVKFAMRPPEAGLEPWLDS
eukprot:3739667-Amphidinium_carterae.1